MKKLLLLSLLTCLPLLAMENLPFGPTIIQCADQVSKFPPLSLNDGLLRSANGLKTGISYLGDISQNKKVLGLIVAGATLLSPFANLAVNRSFKSLHTAKRPTLLALTSSIIFAALAYRYGNIPCNWATGKLRTWTDSRINNVIISELDKFAGPITLISQHQDKLEEQQTQTAQILSNLPTTLSNFRDQIMATLQQQKVETSGVLSSKLDALQIVVDKIAQRVKVRDQS